MSDGDIRFKTNITKEDRIMLGEALKKIGMMPTTQGSLTLNISPDKVITSVEYKILFR